MCIATTSNPVLASITKQAITGKIFQLFNTIHQAIGIAKILNTILRAMTIPTTITILRTTMLKITVLIKMEPMTIQNKTTF